MKKIFPFRYRVLLLLFFLIFVTYLDRVCISLVGVRVKTVFHLSNEQFGDNRFRKYGEQRIFVNGG